MRAGSFEGEDQYLTALEQICSAFRHDVGNTVNSLGVALQVLKANYHNYSDQKRLEYISRAMEQVERQQRFLEALRLYSRTRVGELVTIAAPPFLEGFAEAVKRKLAGRGIAFAYRPRLPPCHVRVDQIAFGRVLGHVVGNAAEALEGREAPKLDITAAVSEGWLRVAVRDNGRGIPPEHIKKVFVPLFTTKSGRLGLGLAVARCLMHGMRGSMEIGSVLDVATEAVVRVQTVKA